MTVGQQPPLQSLAITANLAPLGFSGFIKASLFIRRSHFYHIPAWSAAILIISASAPWGIQLSPGKAADVKPVDVYRRIRRQTNGIGTPAQAVSI
jgi:hypothetical protein